MTTIFLTLFFLPHQCWSASIEDYYELTLEKQLLSLSSHSRIVIRIQWRLYLDTLQRLTLPRWLIV